MPATYSSFDTLTVGQIESPLTPSPGQLPVLAEIPALRDKAQGAREPIPTHIDQGHAPPPAPRFETSQPAELQAEPSPAEADRRGETHSEDLRAAARPDWEENHWAARVLELESAVRPHARLIVLVALIALTGMTLALLRSPVTAPPQAPPEDVVDAPRVAPSVIADEATTQVAAKSEEVVSAALDSALEPIPVLPAAPHESRAQITAVGPVSAPTGGWGAARQDITPIPPYLHAKNAVGEASATVAGPAETPPHRVAARPAYPTTGVSPDTWRPAPDSGNAVSTPPTAELLPPSRP